jgi:hypothetical protein
MIKNVIIVGLTLVIFTKEVSHNHYKEVRATMNQETINTLESMYYWIGEDVRSGKMEHEVGTTYLANIEGSIIDLRD